MPMKPWLSTASKIAPRRVGLVLHETDGVEGDVAVHQQAGQPAVAPARP